MGIIKTQNFVDIQKANMTQYYIEVLTNRGVPDPRDGLKPGQRSSLFLMAEEKYTSDKAYVKCARINGAIVGKYVPHGTASTYETIVNMYAPWLNNVPLVDKHGNFGTIYGDSPAADRYCITGETLLLQKDGSLIKFKDIIESEENTDVIIKGNCLDYLGKEQTFSKYFNSGKHEITGIETNLGYSIEGSFNHPLLTINEQFEIVWKTLEEIKRGDKIIINTHQFDESKLSITNEQKKDAIFWGGLISEGYSSLNQNYYRIGFSNQNKEYYDLMKESFESYKDLFNLNLREQVPEKTSGNVFSIETESKNFHTFINEKVNMFCKEKEVPKHILNSNLLVQKFFLQSVYQGDGGCLIYLNKRRNTYEGSVYYDSISLNLIRQIQILLLNFGIKSSITKDCRNKNIVFKLNIKGKKYIKLFREKIGFLCLDKNEKLDNLLNKLDINPSNRGSNTNDIIPGLKNFILNNCIKNKSKLKKLNVSSFEGFNENIDLIRESLEENIFNFVKERVLKVKDYIFDTIKVVYKLLEKDVVYSIKVDTEDHSFIANGFINHNTEARLDENAERYLLDELKIKNSVDYKLNYDNTRLQPKILPAKLPMLLFNGSFGIAAGYMTSIPNHNPIEVLDNVIHYIKTGEYKISLPDFPTGGILCNTEEVSKALIGECKSSMRVRAKIIKDENKNHLIVTEIPYGKYLDTILKSIKDSTQDRKEGKKIIPKKIDGIKDIENASEKGKIELIIKVKKGFDLDLIENQLYKFTGLEYSVPLSMVGSIEGNFTKFDKQQELVDNWLDFRIETIKRIKMSKIKEYKLRMHILEGLIKVLSNTDLYYKTLKKSKNKKECTENTKETFELSQKQAEYVIEIPAYRLCQLGVTEFQEEKNELEVKINDEIEFFRNREKLLDLIVDELSEAKKFFKNKTRKTILENLNSKDLLATVPDKDYIFLITEAGLIKKIDTEGQKIQKRGGKGTNLGKIKEDDVPKFNFVANNREILYVFTDQGNLYTKNAYDIPEVSKNSYGLKISQFIDLKKDEKIVAVIGVSQDEIDNDNTALLFVTRKNRTKLTKLSDYKRTNGVIGTALVEGDHLFTVEKVDLTQNNSVFCCLTNGIGINIKIDTIPFVSKSGTGSFIFDNNFFESDENIDVTSANIITEETSHICFLTKEGLIKKVVIDEFPQQIRRGKGRICIRLKGEDKLINSISVNNEEASIRIVTNQMTIATPVTDIPESLRPAYGAKCKQMQDDEEVIDIVIF